MKRTLESGGYEADLYLDTSVSPPIYHFLVTQKDSSTILAWGQEKTAHDAERAAMECMHDFYQRTLELGVSAAG
ncbi:MAG TPA: hypothetical protein VMZ25_01230 [Terriglobales bacterium]|nr:hypothetical protein [Terriglobales bacterium]